MPAELSLDLEINRASLRSSSAAVISLRFLWHRLDTRAIARCEIDFVKRAPGSLTPA